MIAYLNGDITYKTPTYIYVDCHGVGYHVNISLNTYAKLENLQKIKILTYLNVKEDEQTLFGFFDDDERSLFILLISVSGVGVNSEALSALIALGFPKPVVEKQIKTVMEKNPNTDQVEDLIKQVLKQMS